MEKILFATDLDGTLLNDDAAVAPEYAALLNDMVGAGCLFTIASARSPVSARLVLDAAGLRLSAPAVCLNGSLLWDMAADEPVKGFPIEQKAAGAVLELLAASPAVGKFYVLDQSGGRLATYYRDDVETPGWSLRYLRSLETEQTPVLPMRAYGGATGRGDVERGDAGYSDAARNGGGAATRTDTARGGEIIGFSFHDHYTRLDGLHQALLGVDGVKTVYYADTYREGYKFLECGAAEAGKGAGAKAARDLAGADRLYVFGDNFNDLDMYRVADMSFAPVSGEPEMRKIASRVIPSNNDGGVIQTIRAFFCGGEDGAAEA